MLVNEESKIRPDKTVLKSLSQCSFSLFGQVSAVDVKDGKILRIRPYHYDEKYAQEEIHSWKIKKNGKILEPLMKAQVAPYQLAYKKRVYSPNRIKFPLKRVDWDPDGERNSQNRGISKYKRISWDEATALIASEIKRVQKKYGPYAILCHGDGHGETKTVHGPHGCQMLLMGKARGYTTVCRNADSWEGWYWGAEHIWGGALFCGHMTPSENLLNDVTNHTELLLHIGADLETTPWGFSGQFPSQICYWWTELGIKSIYICPDLNYGAAIHADKWIPILPNTDAALHLAISHVWITEGSYDKDYVCTHTYGFEKYEKYVLGKEDGIPKTAEWASSLCGVSEWTIKALSREWASKATSIAHVNGGSYIRGPYSHEPARLEVLNLAMQGVGKSGHHQIKLLEWNHFGGDMSNTLPRPKLIPNIRNAIRKGIRSASSQMFPRDLFADGVLSERPVNWYGAKFDSEGIEDQFKKYTYPKEGCSEIHMIWVDSPCWIGCWGEGDRDIEAIRSQKIEFVVTQHPWMENGCVYSDLILPINTKFEEEDIGTDVQNGQYCLIFREGKCIEPIGESKSDFEAVGEVAKRLGVYDKFNENRTDEEWIKEGFRNSGIQGMISWEEFLKKGYFVVPTAVDWEQDTVGITKFIEDPQANPLETSTGKIEFFAKKLAEHFPEDDERPPVPHWVPFGETLHESKLHKRAIQYPLLLVSNHPKWRVHAEHDDMQWLREIRTCKIIGPDGYAYQTMWLNPRDAEKKGIRDGDIVKIFNDRGSVLAGAYVTERLMHGVVYMDHGARYDPIVTGELDRGGAINTITPRKTSSKNATGMVSGGFLVDVERVDIDELRKRYPEAFNRPYDKASGLCYERIVQR